LAAPPAGASDAEESALGFASEQIEDLYRRAMRGNPKAEFDLAQRYADGHGLPEDSAEVMKWFRRAAEHGSTGAQVNIGLMCGRPRR
jgi:TPR repeat protein